MRLLASPNGHEYIRPFINTHDHLHNRLPALFRYLPFPLLLSLSLYSPAVGQPAPAREVRAVWITTAAGLDWPRSFSREEQQRSLKKIVADLRAAHLNTLFFQVRARGDAYYRSRFEPWAENLTGASGRNPGWDPLQYLLDEAHAAGMEVHAWFNVYKVRGPRPIGTSDPPHITHIHPEWSVPFEGEIWLDPGRPEVREYLLEVALDLVEKYAIDGIHFDFIRYPGRVFPDRETYLQHGEGKNRENWRRENISRFVRVFYENATRLRPMLKVGSAPLGIYDGVADGDTEGSYYAYYQDSKGWLRSGIHDYLAPQVYWSLGSTPGDPDFAALIRRWQAHAAGRHMYGGIGAYKSEVFREIPAQIDSIRAAGMAGHAFFRYGSIQNLDMFQHRYATIAIIPPMRWKDSIPPLPPSNVTVAENTPNIIRLAWIAPGKATDGDTARRYAIYRLTSGPGSVQKSWILAATTAGTSHTDTVSAAGPSYTYAVTALDKGQNESNLSNLVAITPLRSIAAQHSPAPITALSTAIGTDSVPFVTVTFHLPGQSRIALELFRTGGGVSADSVMASLAPAIRDGGTHVVEFRPGTMPGGRYLLRLTADGSVIEQPIEIPD